MYNNIDTEHTICEIEAWLLEISSIPNFPNNFPLNAVIAAMKIIMRNNHFEFGDLNFLQLPGTAMGTSSACMWATIYYGIHENRKLLPEYEARLHDGNLTRWIDDLIGLWTCHECRSKTCHQCEQLKKDLPFGQLT